MNKIETKQNLENHNFLDFKDIEDDIIDILYDGSIIEIDEILGILENSKELKDKKFLKVSYLTPRLTFHTIVNGKKEIIIYNLETEKFEEKVFENISEAPQKLEKGNLILSAMDNIFYNNTLEIFGNIDGKDILKTDEFDKFGLKLKGKNLRDLQIIFRENLKELEKLEGNLNDIQKKEFLKQEKKYLEIFMGVGDKYEGGANYLIESKQNFSKIVEDLVNNQNITQVFLYMSELHQKIDGNNYQSSNVEKSYKMLIDLFNDFIFARLKKENASEQDFITFSKILTGRGNYKDGKFESRYIDDNLRNPELASEVLMYVFKRNGGMFEKMGLRSLDSNLKGKKVGDKINLFKKQLLRIEPNLKDERIILNSINLGSLISLEDKKYEELGFEDQTKLTILDRLIKKLVLKLGFGVKIDKNDEKNNFESIILEVTKESQKFLENKINISISSGNIFDKSFWFGKKAEDFGLTGSYKEAYDLFVDMNGIGLLNLSDRNIESFKLGGKIGVIMVASIISAILTGGTSLVLQGAVAGGVGSVSSWVIMPKGYDSEKEMVSDLGSDLLVGTVTGAIGGKLTQIGIDKFGKTGHNGLKTLTIKQESLLTGLDVSILGLGAELGRVSVIEKIFENQNMIIDLQDDDLQKFYTSK